MIGTADQIDMLLTLLHSEDDAENQTWAMAALIALARHKTAADVCEELGLTQSPALIMAGHLLRTPPANLPDDFRLDVESADDLSLMWGALLEGYGRAPAGLFHDLVPNIDVLKALHSHSEPTVSEYSIWALWQNSLYGTSDLGFPLDQIGKRAPNARRWVHRVITKWPLLQDAHVDLISDLRRDDDTKAREGLALGLRRTFNPRLPPIVSDWFSEETEATVQRAMLEHMAANASVSGDYFAMVVDRFTAMKTPDARKRLLAVATGQLYNELTRIDILEKLAGDTLTLGLSTPFGSTTMNTFNIGGSVQNLVTGSMTNSANQAIQTIDNSRINEREILSDIMKFLDASGLPEEEKATVQSAIVDVAQQPTPENKATLLGTLKGVASGVTIAAGMIDPLHHLITSVAHVFGIA